jgi:hypothetical protein
MKNERDKQIYYYLIMIIFFLTLLILFMFGEKTIPYLLFSGIVITALFQLFFLMRKNKIWFFLSFFHPNKFTKTIVITADILMLIICLFIAIIFIKIKFF